MVRIVLYPACELPGTARESPIVTAYPFWGGPWDGDMIDYADHETPDDYLGPDDVSIVNGKLEGLYLLNDAENGYVWVPGPWPVASDNPSAAQEPTE